VFSVNLKASPDDRLGIVGPLDQEGPTYLTASVGRDAVYVVNPLAPGAYPASRQAPDRHGLREVQENDPQPLGLSPSGQIVLQLLSLDEIPGVAVQDDARVSLGGLGQVMGDDFQDRRVVDQLTGFEDCPDPDRQGMVLPGDPTEEVPRSDPEQTESLAEPVGLSALAGSRRPQ
jgi:hypothetical protein